MQGAKLNFATDEATQTGHWSFTNDLQRPVLPSSVSNVGEDRSGSIHRGRAEARAKSSRPEHRPTSSFGVVFFDLIGLPPTPEELRAFLADDSADAYEKVVDGCFAPPARRALGPALDGRLAYSDWDGYNGTAPASRTSGDGGTGSSSRSTPTRATTGWSSRCSPATSSRRTTRDAAGDRLPRPQLVQVQPQQLARQHGRAHGQGVPRRDDQLRPVPRPQVRSDQPRKNITASARSSRPDNVRNRPCSGEKAIS